MDEPLGCPFCGAELDLIETSDDRQRFYRHPYSICCLDGFEVDEFDGDLAAWNHRAPWTVTREELRQIASQFLSPDDQQPRNAISISHRQSGKTAALLFRAEALVEALGGKVEG